MRRFSLCQGHSGMPQGRNSIFLSAPHCFHPTDSCPTCFYTISRHNGVLTGGGGAAPKSHYYPYHCHYSCTGPERSGTAQASSLGSAQGHILNRKEGRKVDLLSPGTFLAIPLNTIVTQKTEHVPSVPGRPSGTPPPVKNCSLCPSFPSSVSFSPAYFSCAGSLLILRWLSSSPMTYPSINSECYPYPQNATLFGTNLWRGNYLRSSRWDYPGFRACSAWYLARRKEREIWMHTKGRRPHETPERDSYSTMSQGAQGATRSGDLRLQILH